METSSLLDLHAHGGKRAVLRFFVYGIAASLGKARKYRSLDWREVRRLVFVCKGNISRSPFAAAIAARHELPATSVGLDATSGVAAAPQAILTAAEFGVDLRSHRAKSISDFEFMHGDLVVAFEPMHLKRLNRTIGNEVSWQASLLAAWLRPPNLYIHDPYGSSPDYFRRCFRRIERAVDSLSRDQDHEPT